MISIAVLLCAVAHAFMVSYSGDKVVMVRVQNTEAQDMLNSLASNKSLGIEIWNNVEVGEQARLRIPSKTVPFMSQYHADLMRNTIIEDLQKIIDSQNNIQDSTNGEFMSKAELSGSKEFFRRYSAASDIHAYLDKLPLKMKVIGKTFEKRDIKMYEIGNGSKKIMLNGGIHAREWISPMATTFILQFLTENNTISRSLLNAFTFMVIPVLNEDGQEYSWTIDRLWRKNRQANNGSTCIGIDLNRNFDFKWGMTAKNTKAPGSSDPCDDTYFGLSREIAPESKALANLIRNTTDLISFVDVHSFSQMILFPFGDCTEIEGDVGHSLGAIFIKAAKSPYGTEYSSGSMKH